MSHAATNWAIKQRGLKPATKIVLWQLADRHNADTGQCNPKQSRLADDCEMSRSTLNVHLAELERLGLIKRVTSIDEKTKRQRPTSYILIGYDRENVSEIRTRNPSPGIRNSRVRFSDTKNPVNEPGKRARDRAVNPDRPLVHVRIGSDAEKRWQAWLLVHSNLQIDELAERSEHAGEAVWLMPLPWPPADGDKVQLGIVTRWILQRKASGMRIRTVADHGGSAGESRSDDQARPSTGETDPASIIPTRSGQQVEPGGVVPDFRP